MKQTLQLSQTKYTIDILVQFGMNDCHSVGVPLESGHTTANTAAINLPDIKPYQRLIGSLMYLAVATRVDIAQAVNTLARVMSAPTEHHWDLAKRVLRYLKGTSELGITFSGGSKNILIGYTDSDWAGDINTRRSCTGYVFMLNKGCISWNSKLQSTVTLSTAEAEYMSMCTCMQEGIFLRNLLRDMYLIQQETVINEDNQGSIALAKNPISSTRSKHIDIKFHFVREKIKSKEFYIQYCSTEFNIADLLTKPLSKERFVKLRDVMLGRNSF